MPKTKSLDSSTTEPEDAIDPFVRALGTQGTLDLLLKFGGSAVYVSENPRAGSRLVEVLGSEAVRSLVEAFGVGHLNVPLGNAWAARQMAARGVGRAEIGRALRIARNTLRAYLSDTNAAASA